MNLILLIALTGQCGPYGCNPGYTWVPGQIRQPLYPRQLQPRVVTKPEPAIVKVEVSVGGGEGGAGSGWVYEVQRDKTPNRGIVVTAAHNLKHSSQIKIIFTDGMVAEGKLLCSDAIGDIAVLEYVETRPQWNRLVVAANNPSTGEPLTWYGYNYQIVGGQPVRTLVRGTGPVKGYKGKQLVYVPNPMHPQATSGGPVVNSQGHVVSIVTQYNGRGESSTINKDTMEQFIKECLNKKEAPSVAKPIDPVTPAIEGKIILQMGKMVSVVEEHERRIIDLESREPEIVEGPAGPPGPPGKDGLPGKDGKDGKPYELTEADKIDIANLVLVESEKRISHFLLVFAQGDESAKARLLGKIESARGVFPQIESASVPDRFNGSRLPKLIAYRNGDAVYWSSGLQQVEETLDKIADQSFPLKGAF